MALTLHADVGLALAEHVGGGAGVVAKVLVDHGADEHGVAVALLLHVPPAVGVEEHGVLVPEDVGRGLGVDDADELDLVADAAVDGGALRLDLGFVWNVQNGNVFTFAVWQMFEGGKMARTVSRFRSNLRMKIDFGVNLTDCDFNFLSIAGSFCYSLRLA